MGVFKKQGVYWIDDHVHGHRKRERTGPDKRLAEAVLRKRKVRVRRAASCKNSGRSQRRLMSCPMPI
jgi:hypothetical protein